MSYLPFALALLAVSASSFCFFPSVWLLLIDYDDSLELHESGVAAVASSNPFRETGPPACMAKLIMLRHKINQSSMKKRKPSYSYSQPRPPPVKPLRQRANSWSRIMKPIGKQR